MWLQVFTFSMILRRIRPIKICVSIFKKENILVFRVKDYSFSRQCVYMETKYGVIDRKKILSL